MSNYTIECNIYSMYLKIMYCSDKTKKNGYSRKETNQLVRPM